MKMKYVCPCCGSEELSRAALARWDVEKQDWVLLGVLPEVTCEGCGEEFEEVDEAREVEL